MLPLSLVVSIPGARLSGSILLRTVPNYKHPRTSHPTNFTAPQLSALVMCCKNLFHSHSDRVFLSGNKLVMCVNWNGDGTWADYHRVIIPSRLQTEASVNDLFRMMWVSLIVSGLANPCTDPILTPPSPQHGHCHWHCTVGKFLYGFAKTFLLTRQSILASVCTTKYIRELTGARDRPESDLGVLIREIMLSML